MSAFNHVGHCVTDVARSRRFYEELLGFSFDREIQPPDEGTAQLLRLEPPAGLTAAYLTLDGFVLELLYFDRPGNPPARPRVMNEPGLTHISLSVDDIPALLVRVPDYGGEVLADTDLGGMAVMIRDPDGQLIELLPMAYRDALAAEQAARA
jgi:catechol 2,3-dioxygenase-like lactoylglutathione lyase family enzyme